MSRHQRVLIVILVLANFAIGIYFFTGCSNMEAAPLVSAKQSQQLPAIELRDEYGTTFSTKKFLGKPLFVQFVNPLIDAQVASYLRVRDQFANPTLSWLVVTKDAKEMRRRLPNNNQDTLVEEGYEALTEIFGIAGSKENISDIEARIKFEAIDKASNVEVVSLKINRRFDFELAGQGALMYPVSLDVASNGDVYVVDNNAHAIRYIRPDSNSIATLSTGEGKLVWPHQIRIQRDSLRINDNEGIKQFDRKGSFHLLLRTFYQIDDFALRDDGAVYVNPSFQNLKPDNPLVVELDKTGKRVKGFGHRLNTPNRIGLDDLVYLSTTKDYLIAVFIHRPIVHVYDLKGNLVREFSFSHPSFQELSLLNKDEKFANPEPNKYRLPEYAAGTCVIGDRLLVLLSMPQLEIIEFDFMGQEIKRYRGDLSPQARRYDGFGVHRSGNSYSFWTVFIGDEKKGALVELTPEEDQAG